VLELCKISVRKHQQNATYQAVGMCLCVQFDDGTDHVLGMPFVDNSAI
jgi:hypothetical protein